MMWVKGGGCRGRAVVEMETGRGRGGRYDGVETSFFMRGRSRRGRRGQRRGRRERGRAGKGRGRERLRGMWALQLGFKDVELSPVTAMQCGRL